MLLAIDTATQRASLALHDGTTLRGECTWEAAHRHTVTLLPHLNTLLEESGVAGKALTAVAVCIGPGSYTGVRIGVAVAKGLALAGHIPLVGIPTFEILVAAQPPDTRPLYVVFAAGRRRIGYARYVYADARWQAETDIALADWEELPGKIEPPALLVGELDSGGAALERLPAGVTLPAPVWHLRRAGFLAELAWQQLRAGCRPQADEIVPLYAQ